MLQAAPPKDSFYSNRAASGRPAGTKFCSDEFISVVGIQPASADIDKGGSGIEHMVLGITGMTCTGCETKLQKGLGTLPPITNLKTSLVIARVEFNLDTPAMSPEAVMKHLERTTEFKCERISTQGSNLEVIPTENVKDFLDQPLPLGVGGMQLVGKGVVRINFDPKVIGARRLIEDNPKYPCSLAPPPVDPGLAVGSKHVREMGYMTLLSIVLTLPILVLSWAPLRSRPITYGAVSLVLATIIQVVIAGPFYPKAFKSLIFSRMIEMDLLIVLSTSAAYIFSVVSFGYLVSGHPLSTGEFFETSTLLVTLIMVGRWVAALSRQKAVESIRIRSLQTSRHNWLPKMARALMRLIPNCFNVETYSLSSRSTASRQMESSYLALQRLTSPCSQANPDREASRIQDHRWVHQRLWQTRRTTHAPAG